MVYRTDEGGGTVGLQDGDRIFYGNGGNASVGGLSPGDYYVRILDPYTIKLYDTQAEALDGGEGFSAGDVDDGDDHITFGSAHGFVQNQSVTYVAPEARQFGPDFVEISETNDDIISLEDHGFSDGQHVTYRVRPGDTVITGLVNNGDYYVEKVSDNELKLYTPGSGGERNYVAISDPGQLNPDIYDATDDDVHYLSIYQHVPIQGLEDGKTYYVDIPDPDGDPNTIRLLDGPGGSVVSIDAVDVAGAHVILPAGI
jgi:hypothetical protein